MKKIYLVRHGQTNANKQVLFQGPDERLSDEGIMQANRLAERVQNLAFKKLIVSDYTRTQQTAEPITELTKVPIELSELFREEKHPTSWTGRSEQTEEGKQFYTDLVERAEDPQWRIEDMENPSDVLARIKKALAFLEAQDEETILVVTHGNFLKQFIGYVLIGCQDDLASIAALRKSLKTTNTGISALMYEHDRWRVLTWNDHAHFAE